MVDFNNLTSSETDRVKNAVTTSVEEKLGRRHRGVYWTGLSFALSLEATTHRVDGETLYEKQQRVKWRSKNRPSSVVPNYRLRQGIGESVDVGRRLQSQVILSRASITREACLRPCCQCQIN